MKGKLRKDCPMRHENGNCMPAGGFCTANNDCICKALHNAYDDGYIAGQREGEKMARRLDSNDICNLLENLIGETEPIGDSAADGAIEQNLMMVVDVLDWCLDRFFMTANHIHSEYDSERRVGKRAYAVLDEIQQWCQKKVEELA